jgi:hypothetical protein
MLDKNSKNHFNSNFMMEGGELMMMRPMPLSRQVGMVFNQVAGELKYLSSGIVFMFVRNNEIGKFGVKHDPIQCRNGQLQELPSSGLSESQIMMFREMAVKSLKLKKNWTHGEILFEFALQGNTLVTSVQLESNYNMANVVLNLDQYSKELV